MASDPLDQAKSKVADAVDRLADELEKLSHQIHANPELCFKEEKASAWLTGFLEKQGARIERGVGGLPTAFRATVEGTGPRWPSWRSTMPCRTSGMPVATTSSPPPARARARPSRRRRARV